MTGSRVNRVTALFHAAVANVREELLIKPETLYRKISFTAPSTCDESTMRKIKPLFLAWLTVLLMGLVISGPSPAFDGGDGDGGGDDAGIDDGGDDQGDEDDGNHHDGTDHAGDRRHDGQGHQGHHGGDRHHHGGGRHHFPGYGYGWGWGPGFGPPFGFGAFGYMPPYYPPFYAYPRVAVQPSAPVYIQQQNTPAAPSAGQQGTSYWHYCRAEGGYYPDVKECPDGWMQVPPQAQSNNSEQSE